MFVVATTQKKQLVCSQRYQVVGHSSCFRWTPPTKKHIFLLIFSIERPSIFDPLNAMLFFLEDFDGLLTLNTSFKLQHLHKWKKKSLWGILWERTSNNQSVACCTTPCLSQEKLLGSAVRPSRANMPWPENRFSQSHVGSARCQNGSREVDLLWVVQVQLQHWSQKAQVHGFQRLTESLELYRYEWYSWHSLGRTPFYDSNTISKWVLSCGGRVITGRGGPGRWMAHSYHTCVYKGISVL